MDKQELPDWSDGAACGAYVGDYWLSRHIVLGVPFQLMYHKH